MKKLLLAILFLTLAPKAQAACNFHAVMTTTTKDVSTWSPAEPCTVSTVEGIDKTDSETSTINTAALTIPSNATITINSSGKLIVGSLTLQEGGSIAIQTGGEIKLGSPLYITDTDADGWPSDFTLYDATASGRRRLALMRSYVDTVDCNDTDDYRLDNTCCTVATRYRDADGDGYGDPNDSISACPTAGYVDNNTDCYDSNANAYPGSATCSTADRGDGSYDYDCSSTTTKCGTNYQYSGATYTASVKVCYSKCDDCCAVRPGITAYSVVTINCGSSGKTCTGTTAQKTCNDCGGTCNCSEWINAYVCTSLSAAGTQACQ